MPKYSPEEYQNAIRVAREKNMPELNTLVAAFKRDYPNFESDQIMQRAQPGRLEAGLRGAAQGATLGYSDEITGLLESAFTDKTYGQARDESRNANVAAQRANPGTYLSGEVGSAFIPGLGTLGALARAPRLAAGLTRTGAAALTGLLDGTVAGGGYSEAEDPFGIAQDAALTGGASALGAGVFSMAAPPLIRGGQHAWDTIRRGISETPERFADRRIAGRLFDDGFETPEAAEEALRELGPDAMPADLGPNMRAEAEAAVKLTPGPTRRRAEEALRARQAGQQDRLNTAARENLDPSWDDYPGFMEHLKMTRKAVAGPLYAAAGRQPIRMTERLRSLVDRRSGDKVSATKQAWDRSEQYLLDDIDRMVPIGNPRTGQFSSMARWDATLKVLQDDISSAIRAGKNETARLLLQQKRALTEELYAQNPAYREARAAFAGSKQLEDAAETGRALLENKKLQDFDVAELLRSYTPGETDAMRIGLLRGVMDKVTAKELGHNSASAFMPERVRSILRETFPDGESLRRFLDVVDTENVYRSTLMRVEGGSRTASLMEQVAPGLDEASAVAGAATGNPISAVASYLLKKLTPGKHYTPEQAEAVGRILFEHLDTTDLQRIYRSRRIGPRGTTALPEQIGTVGSLAPVPFLASEIPERKHPKSVLYEE